MPATEPGFKYLAAGRLVLSACFPTSLDTFEPADIAVTDARADQLGSSWHCVM